MAPSRSAAAAGGVVWRDNQDHVDVALVHRPRYDDWTLPKGKLDDGETELAAAVREVKEEIGSEVAVTRRIGRVHYTADEVPKTVTYWAMRDLGGTFVPNKEIDELVWLPPAKAHERMTYDLDRGVLADFVAAPLPDALVVLLRHARAGKRSEWHGDDVLRPLDPVGVAQARVLVPFLLAFRPTRIVSATPLRCQQTVAPLAEQLELEIEVDSAFTDDAFTAAPERTHSALLTLAKPGSVTVVCSQGTTIPSLVDRFAPARGSAEAHKGASWVLSLADGEVIAADYYDPPL